ncbi:MAG: hypothetical protein HUJ29_05555 [Gammaproteobacteria bacterium]|nr:hypothetical protein [Gammaproteobacteria bacterium]
MSNTRNFIAILILGIAYVVVTVLFAPYDWFYLAVAPTAMAVVGFYLASGAVLARAVVSAMAPIVALPILSLFFQDNFRIIIGYAVFHAVLIGAFLGLLWGNVHRYLVRGKVPKL